MSTPTTSEPGATASPRPPAWSAAAPGHVDVEAAPATPVATGWWAALLVLGILIAFYGFLVMSLRPAAVASVAVLAGVSFVLGGAAQFLLAAQLRGGWRLLAYLAGALGLVAGIAAAVWPAMTIVVLAVFTVWSLAIGGILRIVGTFAGPRHDLWWVGLVAGVAQLALALWAAGSPDRVVLLFVNLVGLWLVVTGVDCIVSACAFRSGRVPASSGVASSGGEQT